jgi:hypothetical protein
MLLEQADNVVIVVGAATGVYKYFALDAAKYISLSTPSSQIKHLWHYIGASMPNRYSL